MGKTTLSIEDLIEEFEFLGDWRDQCQYLIELGDELADLPEDQQCEQNLVRGCQARVWMIPELHQHDGRKSVEIRAKSDARIVDGLIVVLLALANQRSPEEILAVPFKETFARLGLETHLVPQRRNGLHAMVSRIRSFAALHCDVDAQPPAAAVAPADAATPTTESSAAEASDAKASATFDAEAVRNQFPALQQEFDGVPVTFLDSAASAQKPQSVIDAEREVYEKYYANAYRGVYRFGDRVSNELERTRETIRRFIGCESVEEVVIQAGATMAINTVASGWGRKFLRPGDEVLVNVAEHHANLVPWQGVTQQTGAKLNFIPLADNGRLDLSRLDEVLHERTRLVAVSGMSNVLGAIPELQQISERAKQVGALLLVDGAQSTPHLPTSVVEQGIDFLAFSGHKLYGPSGVGVLYARRELLESMDPLMLGGHMVELVEADRFVAGAIPAKFEAGTPPIAQAIALRSAIEFVEQMGLEQAHSHEQQLLAAAFERLKDIDGLTIYGPLDLERRGAIVSFTIADTSAQDLASLLDVKGVCVRHGHHCAMPLHQWLNVTATVRASFAAYNTLDDVHRLAEAVEFAQHRLKRK